ncbi:hypothetical protein NQ318_017516 [Aromia moschata]|uniref:DUF4817 domain-containing protein n=1 Tax=Aromia moschata TaxID=1265417 RepID=A0AAV8Z0G3_9CUCU|nr:hypothetical protein NQ318_017516 [Aromia moschata]
MVYLTEMHKITILQMMGYGDRTRTQAEVVRLFQEYPELPPISQDTVSKIEKQFRERIIGENIIGPFFIDGNFNGETYLALLQNNVVPTMANLYPAEGNPQLRGNAICVLGNVDIRQQLIVLIVKI